MLQNNWDLEDEEDEGVDENSLRSQEQHEVVESLEDSESEINLVSNENAFEVDAESDDGNEVDFTTFNLYELPSSPDQHRRKTRQDMEKCNKDFIPVVSDPLINDMEQETNDENEQDEIDDDLSPASLPLSARKDDCYLLQESESIDLSPTSSICASKSSNDALESMFLQDARLQGDFTLWKTGQSWPYPFHTTAKVQGINNKDKDAKREEISDEDAFQTLFTGWSPWPSLFPWPPASNSSSNVSIAPNDQEKMDRHGVRARDEEDRENFLLNKRKWKVSGFFEGVLRPDLPLRKLWLAVLDLSKCWKMSMVNIARNHVVLWFEKNDKNDHHEELSYRARGNFSRCN